MGWHVKYYKHVVVIIYATGKKNELLFSQWVVFFIEKVMYDAQYKRMQIKKKKMKSVLSLYCSYDIIIIQIALDVEIMKTLQFLTGLNVNAYMQSAFSNLILIKFIYLYISYISVKNEV